MALRTLSVFSGVGWLDALGIGGNRRESAGIGVVALQAACAAALLIGEVND